MGPKIEAACRFVERTGGEAVIGALSELRDVAAGRTGTRVFPPAEALYEDLLKGNGRGDRARLASSTGLCPGSRLHLGDATGV